MLVQRWTQGKFQELWERRSLSQGNQWEASLRGLWYDQLTYSNRAIDLADKIKDQSTEAFDHRNRRRLKMRQSLFEDRFAVQYLRTPMLSWLGIIYAIYHGCHLCHKCHKCHKCHTWQTYHAIYTMWTYVNMGVKRSVWISGMHLILILYFSFVFLKISFV